jgi:hypothetical protein
MVICRRNYEDTCDCRACEAHRAIMAAQQHAEEADDER